MLKWRKASARAGNPWVCSLDEIGHWNTGVVPDEVDPGHDQIRDLCLWGSLMAGGAGVEWYFGYGYAHNDLNAEDFRTRQNMWTQSRSARKFFETLPLENMVPSDPLVSGGASYCISIPGSLYVVYMPAGARNFTLNHTADSYVFSGQWYNPRTGEMGDTFDVPLKKGGNIMELPREYDRGDWVLKISM